MHHPLFTITLIAAALVAVTVVVHAIGLAGMLKVFSSASVSPALGFWPVTWFLIRVAWWLILVHLVEIAVWGMFYLWQGCMPDGESAFYFAGVTYTTVGYGDLVLPPRWRMLGPVEGMTGILMCGLSTGFFFALATRLFPGRDQGQGKKGKKLAGSG
jgi:preprotein translocase subunit SecG